MTRPSMLPSAQCTASASRGCCFRGSIPSLCAPLSTLHRHPHGGRCMTRGQCGLLDLHWKRLALSTPCRSPGARIVNLAAVICMDVGGVPAAGRLARRSRRSTRPLVLKDLHLHRGAVLVERAGQDHELALPCLLIGLYELPVGPIALTMAAPAGVVMNDCSG